MTYTAEDFNRFCYEAAGQFLQTAVVIDNEAIFCESTCKIAELETGPEEVLAPPSGTLRGQKGLRVEAGQGAEPPVEAESTRQTLKVPPDPRKNILKAKPLIDAFADRGVVCSIIRPDLHEAGVVERAISLASVADIVVVDWALGKTGDETEGSRAKQIITRIIEGDLKKRGRLRLIAVYTAERNPGTILDALFEHITPLDYPDEIKKDNASFTIQNRFLKIVVLLKPAAGGHIPGCVPVDFSALPDRLQKLFAELNRGLLPSVTLRAIASIREGTHHLLAVLHKDLDPALVGHRCLLPHPEDAEEFCEDLVSGEIRSIVALAKIGAQCAGSDKNELWLASKFNEETEIGYSEYKITRAQISSLLVAGGNVHKSTIKAMKRERASRTGKNEEDPPSIKIMNISQIFHGDESGGRKINHEFSRLSSFKRETFGLRKPPSGWMPRLSLGTLIQRVSDSKLFICLQPRCESVRFETDETSRAFPFLEIGKGKQKELIVVNTVGTDMCVDEKELFFEPKPKNQVVFEFQKPEGNSVIAQLENDFYMFTDLGGSKFYWLGDLKDPLAQNIVGKMSDVVGSVGINPYEWLRLQSSN